MTHNTSIHNNSVIKTITADFTIIKNIHFTDEELQDTYIKNLNHLKGDTFNQIKIPEFDYSIDGLTVICTSQFIKGYYAINKKYRKIIYKDLVHREDHWTFTDYHFSNFISEINSEDIFAVDLQSYNYCPYKPLREERWQYHADNEKKWLNAYY